MCLLMNSHFSVRMTDLLGLSTAAGDWIEPETSNTGRIGILIGIALMGTMVVALFCFLFIRSLTNEQDFNLESSNEVDKTAKGLDGSVEIL